MPYVDDSIKNVIDSCIEEAVDLDDFVDHVLKAAGFYDFQPKLPGVANYIVSTIVTELLCKIGSPKHCYSGINAAIGVLECAKMELYRRVAAPYEDLAINTNGDIEAYKS